MSAISRRAVAIVALIGIVVFPRPAAIQAQRNAHEEALAEAVLRDTAEKALKSGLREFVWNRSHHDSTQISSTDRIAAATIVAVTATGETETRFYQPPPTFITLFAFRIDRRVATKGSLERCIQAPPPAGLPDLLWVPFPGGQRTVSGVSVRDERNWPVMPAAGRRYPILGERCSEAMMELTFGPQDIYELANDDLIVPNPWNSEYVRAINNLGSLSKLEAFVAGLR